MGISLDAADVLPRDAADATLVARVFDPSAQGPSVVTIRGEEVVDLSTLAPTVSSLLERPDAVEAVRSHAGTSWPLAEVLAATTNPAGAVPRFLAPVDLQVLKAAGVTFVRSMLERVIEERADGDPALAEEVRAKIGAIVQGHLSNLRPGSVEAAEVKRVLQAEGLWSQYLEVGIGPDPEIFTKAPVLSAVGPGAEVGVLARSVWNNPEPELVLVVNSRGTPVGATLGNDVNLRDFEGRSALLLTEAKDNNASCAIGPFLRLFDDGFTLADAKATEISLDITGPDGFELHGVSAVSEISRELEDLVSHAFGTHHRYPDGFVLFTGTMFAPTEDRDRPGEGFTHRIGDVVRISSPRLGALTNVVTTAENAEDWTFGITALMTNLAARGLLS
ncbi:fumarylacetoacetate hydrolase family protein [Lentzea sp. JNUCC 0626]|uniref:fumarylacetoacetate hydrolase family protein n=1 Tax=Lentzea sp. JNUCC 0626 TaxID=3367513 RepID=UPI0037495968